MPSTNPTLADDVTTETRVNSVVTNLQFQPDIAVDDAVYGYAIFNYIAWSTGSCDEEDLDYNIVYRY